MIETLFEDEILLAVDKPAGLPTQASVDKSRENLFDLLKASGRWPYLALHHRLDVPTSGVILLCKDQKWNKAVAELFTGRLIQKTYLCLVNGVPKEKNFEIKNHLKSIKVGKGKTKMVSTKSGGDFAHTDFSIEKEFTQAALIRAQPHTGRMHQIRVHLAENGFPILGDALYFRADRKYPRLLLHAESLQFPHPKTQKLMKISSPLPEDFRRAFLRLESKSLPPSES